MAGRDRDTSRPATTKRNKSEHETQDDLDQKQRKRVKVSPSDCSNLPTPYSLVVNGCPATKGQFPYQVALNLIRGNGDIAKGGGVIIANQWILTAAHLCRDAKKAVVLAGAFPTQYDPEQTGEADLIVMQDAYRTENVCSRFIVHDIALLHLSEPLKCTELVKPVCLPSISDVKNDFAGRIAVLSGWGKTGEMDEKPAEGKSTLNFAYEKILSNQEAAKMLQVDELPSTILAAIGTDGRACSCNGDSGGPLVLKNDKGKLIVVGIVSHRIGNCGGPLPHLLTRVSSYVSWISKVIQSSAKGKKAVHSVFPQ